jgi:HK97 family phage major capsid protein
MTQYALDAPLAEASKIWDSAQQQKRSVTKAEKAIVEDHLEKAQAAKDWVELGERVERMRGPISGASPADGAQATITVANGGLPRGYDTGPVLDVASEGFRVRNLFPVDRIDTPSVWYRSVTTGSAQAAAVAEAAAKPESTIVADMLEAVARKIALWVPATDELLADGGPQMFSDLVADLTRDLVRVENAQLLSGSGTAPNLRGVLNTTGIQTRARGTDSSLDALLKVHHAAARQRLRRAGRDRPAPDELGDHPAVQGDRLG